MLCPWVAYVMMATSCLFMLYWWCFVVLGMKPSFLQTALVLGLLTIAMALVHRLVFKVSRSSPDLILRSRLSL